MEKLNKLKEKVLNEPTNITAKLDYIICLLELKFEIEPPPVNPPPTEP